MHEGSREQAKAGPGLAAQLLSGVQKSIMSTRETGSPISPLRKSRLEDSEDNLISKPSAAKESVGLWSFARACISHLGLAWTQAWREATRQRGQYLLGFSTVFLVVVISAVLLTVTTYSSVIFLGIAEYLTGELDFVVFPSSEAVSGKLNYTQVAKLFPMNLPLNADPRASGGYYHAPRFTDIDAKLYIPSACQGFNASYPDEPTYPYAGMPLNPNATPDVQAQINYTRTLCQGTPFCLDQLCATSSQSSFKANLFLIDVYRERLAEIGKEWPVGEIPPGYVVIQEDLATNLGASVGQWFFISFGLQNVLSYQYNLAKKASGVTRIPYQAYQQLTVPVRVYAIIPTPLGKNPATSQIMTFMDYSTIASYVAGHLHPWHPPVFLGAFKNVSSLTYDQVPQIVMTKSVPRYMNYLADFTTTTRQFLRWSNDIRFQLGAVSTYSTLSVLFQLENTNQLASFVNLLMLLVIIVLSGLSVFLLYSLLMVSVETKMFELGVLRMVGMKRIDVMLLLMSQAMSYSVPALVIGLAASQVAFAFGKTPLESFLSISLSPYLTANSIFLAVAMALVVPIISSIIPIMRALGLNLHDALDRYRPVVKATIITIERSRSSVDPSLGLVGFVLTIVGLGIYYFFPMALLNDDLPLMFGIFLAILIGMIGGMTVVASNFTPLLEKLLSSFLFLILFFENKAMKPLMDTNLVTHRERNRKTSLLYAVSLSFIIFLSVTANVQISSLQYSTMQSLGADIVVYSDYLDSAKRPAPIVSQDLLEAYSLNNPFVLSFAWSTVSLARIDPGIQGTQVSNYGKIDIAGQNIYGVSPGVLDMMANPYLQVDAYDSQLPPYSPGEQLYTPKGLQSGVMGGYYQSEFVLQSYSEQFLVRILKQVQQQVNVLTQTLMPLFFAKATPVFRLTSFPRRTQDLLVSLPKFLSLTNGTYKSVHDLPIRAFYIKLAPNVNTSTYNRIKREVAALLQYENMQDVAQQLNGVNQALSALSLIFDIITVLIMVVTFFSLNTSMYVNILEQSKEIGILRALGVERWGMFRLYFYESFVLVISAVALGSIIGSMIGWTMTAQQTVLTQVPISLNFPTRLVMIVVGLSFLSAIFSTVSPVYLIVVRRKLVSVLKG